MKMIRMVKTLTYYDEIADSIAKAQADSIAFYITQIAKAQTDSITKSAALNNSIAPRDSIPYAARNFDIEKIIQINSKEDIHQKRCDLIQLLWGKDGFPHLKQPDKIEEINDLKYKYLKNLKKIQKITINMDFGLHSIAYLFIPKKSINKFIIYHQGHGGDFLGGKNIIGTFLARGYTVVGMSMQLLFYNRRQIITTERFGPLYTWRHENFLRTKDKHPMRFFITPVVVIVNFAEKNKFEQIDMIGISGGGLETILCAAIDDRISFSYPAAGSLPLYLRSYDWGDWEQYHAEFYYIANYPELYILGSYGEGRKQLQILNKFDNCCFGGYRYKMYENVIQNKLKTLGKGHFEVLLDDTHREHKISSWALTKIFQKLDE